jgi:hypothetical protein
MATAARAVAAGADAAFLMNPPAPIAALELARAGELLPAHSAEMTVESEGLLSYALQG